MKRRILCLAAVAALAAAGQLAVSQGQGLKVLTINVWSWASRAISGRATSSWAARSWR
jgi:hypothetical protein